MLQSLDPSLVAEMPRHPGQEDVRYSHLLAGEPQMAVVQQAGFRINCGGPGRTELG